MSSKVFTSASLRILEEAFVAGLSAVRTDPLAPVTVLVPGNLLGLYLRRLLALQYRCLGHVNVYFLTLMDLARSFCAQHLVEQDLMEPPALMSERLFQQMASGFTAEERYFSSVETDIQLELSLFSAVTDLKESGIGAEEFERCCAQLSSLHAGGTAKLKGLAQIYREYERRLRALGWVDRSDILARGASFISSPAEMPTFIYGFYDFNPLQKQFIATLLRNQHVLCFFPWRAGAAFEYAVPSLTWLKNLGCEHVPLKDDDRHPFQRVARRLFTASDEREPEELGEQSLKVISAPGEAREIVEIVREALRWVERDGYAFSDIAILVRNNEPYAPLLVETLSRLGVPHYLHGGAPLGRTRAGQGFTLLITMIRETLSRASVLEFIGHAPLAVGRLGDTDNWQGDVTAWSQLAALAGIVAGKEQWHERLSRLRRRLEDDLSVYDGAGHVLARRNLSSLERLQRFLAGLFEDLEAIPSRGRWSDFARFFSSLLAKLFDATDESERITREIATLSALDCLEEEITLEQFLGTAERAVHFAREPKDGFGKGGIFIGEIMSARGLCFRAVIVPGMVEKIFPPVWRQDPILLDHERQYISETLGKELVQKSRQYDEERLLFAFSLLTARERLLFSYPRLEMVTARERVPSFFLLRLMEVVTGKAANFSAFESWDRLRRVPLSRLFPADLPETVDALEYDLWQAERLVAGEEDSALRYLPFLSPFFESALRAEQARWGQKKFTVFDGCLDSREAQIHLRRLYSLPGLTFSPTALESYARCPFRFFLEKLLRLAPLDEPDPFASLAPIDRGALIHEILRQWMELLKRDQFLPMTREAFAGLDAALLTAADQVMNRYEEERLAGFPLLWELEREQIIEKLRQWLKAEINEAVPFVPSELEKEFLYPFPLNDNETVFLRGRIDRIDIDAEQRIARIIDYKTGKRHVLEDGQFRGGEALQLPIYLCAAAGLLKEAQATDASYAYIGRTGNLQRDSFTRLDWRSKLETLRDILTTLIQNMRAGTFIARPASCTPCAYPWICTPAAAVLYERKRHDPRLAEFERIKEIP